MVSARACHRLYNYVYRRLLLIAQAIFQKDRQTNKQTNKRPTPCTPAYTAGVGNNLILRLLLLPESSYAGLGTRPS